MKSNKRNIIIMLSLVAVAFLNLVGLLSGQFNPTIVQAQYTYTTDPIDPIVGPDDPDIIVGSGVEVIAPSGLPDGARVFTRPLNSRNLGSGEIINFPFIRAVDIFVFYKGQPFKGDFAEGFLVCLRGSGRLLFAPVSGRPRVFGGLQSVDLRPGFVCGFIGQPGTVVLVPNK